MATSRVHRHADITSHARPWLARHMQFLTALACALPALLVTTYRHAIDPPGSRAAEALLRSGGRHAPHHLIAKTLQIIKAKYVDPSKLDPKEMLVSSLQSLQDRFAAVILQRVAPSKLRLKVDVYAEVFDLNRIQNFSSLYAALKEALAFVQKHVEPADEPHSIEYAAISGLLADLDPHSMLLDPEVYRSFKMGTSGSFGGLGIVIAMQGGKLTVVAPIDDTPASRAGIKAGDRIVKVHNESTINMSLTEAVDRLRGEPGTSVVLWIARQGWPDPKRFELVRDIIRIKSVAWRLLPPHIGYIRIKQFSRTTSEDVTKALAHLKHRGMTGLVIDLYNNPGGLLASAIAVADIFVDQGSLVTTVSDAGRKRDSARASTKATKWRGPVVVLVNGGTASASEILAGALRGRDRAVVIGQQTFGKGSVQVLFDNDDGSALKLTIAQFLTPTDISIQTKGILPDIAVEPITVAKDDIKIFADSRVRREKDLRQHLRGQWGLGRQPPPVGTVRYLETPRKPSAVPGSRFSANAAPTEVVDMARSLLQYRLGSTRTTIVSRMDPFLSELKQRQQRHLIEAVGKLGVDWRVGPPTRPAVLVATEQVVPASAIVRAGDKIRFIVTVTNLGAGPAYRVRAMTKSPSALMNHREFLFGRIDPGQHRQWVVTVPIPQRMLTEEAPYKIQFFEEYGHLPAPISGRVIARGRKRPLLAAQYAPIDGQGNRDGLVQIGETIHLRTTIRNLGSGSALDPVALLRNRSGAAVFIRKGRFNLKALAPGAEKTVVFSFVVRQVPRQGRVVLDLILRDNTLETEAQTRIRLPVMPSDRPFKKMNNFFLVTNFSVAFRSGADPEAPILGWFPKGFLLAATGRVQGWLRFQLPDGTVGFVEMSSVRRQQRHTGNRPPQKRPTRIKRRFQLTPPMVVVHASAALTHDPQIRLSGSVTDDTNILDLYVEVANLKTPWRRKKIFYQPNRFGTDPKSMAFSIDVPLTEGVNVIFVVARQTRWLKTTKLLLCIRQASKEP